jgi:4-hydroxy-3-methylbut-2-enyl diphosphate reductase
MEVILARPRGFCAGVVRAIEIVETALDLYGSPVYVLHEIVHNHRVVEDLTRRGARFVEALESVPPKAVLILSAHGVSAAVEKAAKEKGLSAVIDATCPLVAKVHLEVVSHARAGREVIAIGHAEHPEMRGTLGRYERSYGGDIHIISSEAGVAALKVRNPRALGYVTQTTLSVEDTYGADHSSLARTLPG